LLGRDGHQEGRRKIPDFKETSFLSGSEKEGSLRERLAPRRETTPLPTGVFGWLGKTEIGRGPAPNIRGGGGFP